MTAHVFLFLFLSLLFAQAIGAEPKLDLEYFQRQFPHGMVWQVNLFDKRGKRFGALKVLITPRPLGNARGKSCLSDTDTDAVRVEYLETDQWPTQIRQNVTSHGAAKIADGRILMDLTAGMCDAYLLLKGVISPDGRSHGSISTLNLGGEDIVGTYRAAPSGST